MQTIAIVNEKGGTAKTTTTVNLAAALGELGHRVLTVDLDGQAATSRWFGVENDARLADAIIAGGGLQPVEQVSTNVDLAPSCGRIDSIAHELRPTQGGQLRKVLAEHEDHYDFTLIDCPPSLGNRLIGNALLAASHALVPVETSILALDGLRLLLTMLGDIRDGFGHDIKLMGVLACRYDARTRLSRLVLGEMQRSLPGYVCDTIIRACIRLQECPATQSSILSYASQSTAAEDYRALAAEVAAGGPTVVAEHELASIDQSAYVELDTVDRQTLSDFHSRANEHLNRGRRMRTKVLDPVEDAETQTDIAEVPLAPPATEESPEEPPAPPEPEQHDEAPAEVVSDWSEPAPTEPTPIEAADTEEATPVGTIEELLEQPPAPPEPDQDDESSADVTTDWPDQVIIEATDVGESVSPNDTDGASHDDTSVFPTAVAAEQAPDDVSDEPADLDIPAVEVIAPDDELPKRSWSRTGAAVAMTIIVLAGLAALRVAYPPTQSADAMPIDALVRDVPVVEAARMDSAAIIVIGPESPGPYPDDSAPIAEWIEDGPIVEVDPAAAAGAADSIPGFDIPVEVLTVVAETGEAALELISPFEAGPEHDDAPAATITSLTDPDAEVSEEMSLIAEADEPTGAADPQDTPAPDSAKSSGVSAVPFSLDMKLNATMSNVGAIIDDRVVPIGQSYHGAKLIAVDHDSAILEHDGQRYQLIVGLDAATVAR